MSNQQFEDDRNYLVIYHILMAQRQKNQLKLQIQQSSMELYLSIIEVKLHYESGF